MTPDERQMEIWFLLCIRREIKIHALAEKYGVCWRTIYRDIERLSLIYPIQCVRGRHNGGIKLPDWYKTRAGHLSPEHISFLEHLYQTLPSSEAGILKEIILSLTR